MPALLGLLIALAPPARAGECGGATPDYSAERAVTVAGRTEQVVVYVAGNIIREETVANGRPRVTIREKHVHRLVVFDPDARQGMELALPLSPKTRPATRVIDEEGPNGTRVRVEQFDREGAWIDFSRTTCRADGIMIRQTFVSLDPQGREVRGTVTQDRIKVGSLPSALFQVPADVQIVRR
ncbi:MAG: hypothetical protein ABI224_02850 [Acetobacteraceae bacterium]